MTLSVTESCVLRHAALPVAAEQAQALMWAPARDALLQSKLAPSTPLATSSTSSSASGRSGTGPRAIPDAVAGSLARAGRATRRALSRLAFWRASQDREPRTPNVSPDISSRPAVEIVRVAPPPTAAEPAGPLPPTPLGSSTSSSATSSSAAEQQQSTRAVKAVTPAGELLPLLAVGLEGSPFAIETAPEAVSTAPTDPNAAAQPSRGAALPPLGAAEEPRSQTMYAGDGHQRLQEQQQEAPEEGNWVPRAVQLQKLTAAASAAATGGEGGGGAQQPTPVVVGPGVCLTGMERLPPGEQHPLPAGGGRQSSAGACQWLVPTPAALASLLFILHFAWGAATWPARTAWRLAHLAVAAASCGGRAAVDSVRAVAEAAGRNEPGGPGARRRAGGEERRLSKGAVERASEALALLLQPAVLGVAAGLAGAETAGWWAARALRWVGGGGGGGSKGGWWPRRPLAERKQAGLASVPS